MKRIALIIGLLLCLSPVGTASVRAQERVTYTDRKTSKREIATGAIQDETPAGISITIKQGTAPQLIPALDILEVEYKTGEAVKGFEYKGPFAKEKEALEKKDLPDRIKGLMDAQREYDAVAMKLRDKTMPYRYLQYRSALVVVQMARLDKTRRDAAIEALKTYRKDNSDGWEAVPSAKLLAQLQEEAGDILGAQETYKELRILPGVSKELKLESTILVSNLLLRAKKYDEAEKMLSEARALMADDDPQKAIITIHLCESQMKQGKTQDVEKQLQAAINGTSEVTVRAVAHNTLGDYYYEKKQYEDAFWQYLRVDVLYPQDREEHARALYWLSELFVKVKDDKVKAQECLEKLKSKEYETTEFARRAMAK